MLKQFFSSKRNIAFVVGGAAFVIVAAVLGIFLINKPATPEAKAVISEEHTVTRAEWLTMLSDAMGYVKFTENEPYFSDVTAENPAFDSIQLASEYIIIDTASQSFKPKDAATREFVAVTAAKAVGLYGEPTANLSDISGVRDAESIRLAVDNGIFICPDGKFNPNGTISAAECNEIASKVKSFIFFDVDPNHDNKLILNENAIDLTNTAAEISYHGSGAMYLNISGVDTARLKTGTVYILPPTPEYPYGVARKVASLVQIGENEYAVTNEIPDVKEVVKEIDVQGDFYPDYENAILAEGVTGRIIPAGASQTTTIPQGLQIKPMSLSVEATQLITGVDITLKDAGFELEIEIELGDDKEINGTIELNNLHAKVDERVNFFTGHSTAEAVTIYADIKSSLEIAGMGDEKEFELAKIPFPLGASGVSIMAKLTIDISGEVKLSYVENIGLEFGTRKTGGLFPAFHHKVNKHERDIEIEASAELLLGLEPALNAYGLDLLSIYAKVGAGINAKPTLALLCTDISIYMPFKVGAKVVLLPDYEKDIWDMDNSPLQSNFHVENGKKVEECTKLGLEQKEKEEINSQASQETLNSTRLSFTLDYPSNWRIVEGKVTTFEQIYPHYQLIESVTLQNDRGVEIIYSYYSPSMDGNASAIVKLVDASKVADSRFVPAYPQTGGSLNSGGFMVAKLKETGEAVWGTDLVSEYDGATAYAVLPTARGGTAYARDAFEIAFAFGYGGQNSNNNGDYVSCISQSSDGAFTAIEEQEVIAILASFQVQNSETSTAATEQKPVTSEEDQIYTALQKGDFSYFAGTYKPCGIYDDWYGGGERLPNLFLQENGIITGGLVYSSYPAIKPSSVEKNGDGSYLCQVRYSSNANQDYFVIYPEGVIGENPYAYNDPLLTDTVYIQYMSIDGGLTDIIYYKVED